MNIKTVQIQAPTQATNEEVFAKYIEFVDQYQAVSLIQLDEAYFVVKALGRKDYKEIMSNDSLNEYQREEIICEIATLYPVPFDFETCDAGIPSNLAKEILKFSHFTDNKQEAIHMMNYFRSEMVQLHNQINCLINEAFPHLSYDEIENWDMEKTLKYLSRSEWILQNLRGIEMGYDPFTGEKWEEPTAPPAPAQQSAPPVQQNEVPINKPPETINYKDAIMPQAKGFVPGETIEERLERLEKGEIKKEPLTPEKLRELRARFPEVDWTAVPREEDFRENFSSENPALVTP